MKYAALIKRLEKEAGAILIREGSNHSIYAVNGKHFPIPRHPNKEVPTGTLSTILKQAGLK